MLKFIFRILSIIMFGLIWCKYIKACEPDYDSASDCLSYYSKKSLIMRRNEAAMYARATDCVRPTDIFTRLGRDVLLLNRYLFTWDTLKVAAVIVPAATLAYHFDHTIQECFHDRTTHKNINQMPGWTRELARFINMPIIALLGTQAFLSRDDEFRATSQAMLLGLPFVIYINEVIKKMKFDICHRPWHEDFSCTQRTPGGFPSGHVAKATYLAVLYGTRYGPRFSIPLGLIAGFIGVTFLSSNRHYLSQLIAGVGFGAAYGLAASKLVDYKLTHDCAINLSFDEDCRPNLCISWNF